jgi:hypothetical protein
MKGLTSGVMADVVCKAEAASVFSAESLFMSLYRPYQRLEFGEGDALLTYLAKIKNTLSRGKRCSNNFALI